MGVKMGDDEGCLAPLASVEEAEEAMCAIADLLDGCHVARSDLDAVLLITSLRTSDANANLQILKLRALFIMYREMEHRRRIRDLWQAART